MTPAPAPLAVITNRGSTRNLRGDNWIDPLLVGEANVTHIYIDRADEVAAAVRRCADIGARTVVVNGGDGTADLVFAALLNGHSYPELPALALLPGGKTNMTANDWSLRGTPESALQAVLRGRRDGTLAHYIVNRPVLTLRRDAHSPPLYGAFFGAAEVVEGIHFCRKHIYPLKMPNALSHAAAIAVLMWRGLAARSGRGAVTTDDGSGEKQEGHYFVVAVTALNELLLGIRPTSTITPDAALHYLSLRMGPGPILGALPALLRRRMTPGNGRVVKKLDRVTLRFTGAYTLDGELYEAHAEQPLVLEGDRRLDFIRIAS